MKKAVKTEKAEEYIKWFSEIGKQDVKIAGGKGANLGEMYNSGFPVPPGFVILAEAYKYFLEKTGLVDKIYEILNKINVENTAELEETAGRIREMIENAEMPAQLENEILENYEALNIDKNVFNASKDALAILEKISEPVFVAVRSSATAEDTEAASFAGQQETFINIKGNSAVINAVKKCWASLFTARSIYYRVKKGFEHEDVLIAIVIQIMINADKAGVIFSHDPITKSENIVIEAGFGLGEGVVSGKIQPDSYLVSRELKILEKKIADKKIAIVRNSAGQTQTIKLTEERSKSQVLTDSEIKKYADYAIKLEEHYKSPQDIEFAMDSGELFIVQTRPITTLGKKEKIEKVELGTEILKGMPASPGIGSGVVRIVRKLEDLSKIEKGDVLVTKMTNPDMVVTMQKCSAIVTDEGGITAHAAIVSREMGIPAAVGTKNATQILKDGQEITVDGKTGKIYAGKHEPVKVEISKAVETETKIKVIVDLPDFAERASITGIKAVGLVRIEGIIAESRKHPFYFMQQKKIKDYEEIIFTGISKIAEYFDELWVRTSDIRSDEYMALEGAPKKTERNPMLGMHGIRAGLKYPEILKAELLALKRVSEHGKKIGVMMPQVIDTVEVNKVKEIMSEIEFLEGRIGAMIETPAAVQIIEELCMEGIDFISFGTNDLTQYTLAIDRGNEEVQYLYNEMHPAILRQLAYVIEMCKIYQVESSICGQAGSNKEMVEFLVKQGIDSISVNADKAKEISEFVAELERKGLRGVNSDYVRENMTRKKANPQIEEIDKLDIIEKKAEKILKKVQKENIKAIEEKKKKVADIEVNVEKPEEKKTEEKKEDFPEIEIGFNVFADQSGKKQAEKAEEEIGKGEEESEEKPKKKEKQKDEELDIF